MLPPDALMVTGVPGQTLPDGLAVTLGVGGAVQAMFKQFTILAGVILAATTLTELDKLVVTTLLEKLVRVGE